MNELQTKIDHKNVFSALSIAQSAMKKVEKASQNAAYKKPDGKYSRYADLSSVVDAVRTALSSNGLAYYHQVVEFRGELAMRTIIAHGASGTEIFCDVPMIVSVNSMQGMKSATTYAKRIGLESLTGVAPEDEDDDGNAAGELPGKFGQQVARPAMPKTWTDEAFNNSFPKWKSLIESGAKKREEVIAFAATKGALTKAQVDLINAVEKVVINEHAE